MKKITLLLTFIICAYSWQGYAQATCASPVVVTVEADCSTATPYTIDYSTAADLGTSDLSCDTFGTNTGAWLEFTAPASGAVKVSFTDTNEYALFDSCGGTEIVCVNSATNSGQFLSLTPGATYKLAVWKDSASSGTTDVCLEAITCLPPTALNVSVTSATETSISWTAGNSTPETEWEYVVQDAGTGAPAGAGTLTTNNPVALTGLTQNNDYEFYVRAKCGTSDFSDWAGPTPWLQALPPANDDCTGAIALTVNTDLNCTTVTAATTVAATASSQADDVSGTPNTDVWFSFVATGAEHTVVISDVVNQGGGTSTSTDMGMGVYDATGGCMSLTLVDDSDPNTLSLTGLTASTTYYVRAYGWSSSVQYNNFNICVGTPPAPPSPPANDECAGVIALTVNADLSCGTVTAGTTAGATASAEADDVTGTPNTDVWYSFVATDTAHRIEISNVVNQGGGTSTSTDMGMGVYDATGGCMSLTFVDDSDPNTLNLTGLTASTTYYVRVYGWSTSVQYNNFDICVGTTPTGPANDVIGGAIPITPSPAGTGCTTAGFTLNFSTDGTTDSGLNNTCNGSDTGLDQFFTWTATTDGLLWNDAAPGNPGITIIDSGGTQIDCAGTFAADDTVLSGWTIGDVLTIQILDFGAAVSDVAFCLEEFTLPTPPANDDCGGAISLTVNADVACGTTLVGGTLVGATASADGDNGIGTPNDDVWYSFTATNESHKIELQNIAGNSTDLVHELLSGTCGSLASLSITDPNTSTATGLTIGDVYYLRVFSFAATGGRTTTFDICIGTPPPPPANDNCVDASGINTLPFNSVGDATSATNTGGFVAPAGCGGMNDGVWYTFTTIDAGTVDIVLSGTTGWDSELAVYSGSCGALTCVTRADSSGTGGDETLSGVAVDANTQYWIHLGHFSSGTDSPEGPYTIDVSTTDTTTTLGVDNNTLEGFTLFPTIVKEELKFTSQNVVDQITVFSLLGQKVFSSSPNVANSQVNLASLRAGIYIVKVKVGDSTGTYKIIKE